MLRYVPLACALAACDPGWGVGGRVTTVPSGTAPAAPIEGATVRVKCPDAETVEVETDAEGRFTYGTIGFLDHTCEVEVEADGHVSRSFTVDDVCARRYRMGEHRCWEMHVDAALQRAPRAPVQERVDGQG